MEIEKIEKCNMDSKVCNDCGMRNDEKLEWTKHGYLCNMCKERR
jgi:hypothetical protein